MMATLCPPLLLLWKGATPLFIQLSQLMDEQKDEYDISCILVCIYIYPVVYVCSDISQASTTYLDR